MSADENPGSPIPDVFRRQIETLTGNATMALFLMDERQHCVYMNPAAEEMTGFRLEEVSGRPLHDVIHHMRPDGSPYPLAECPIDRAFPRKARERGEEAFVHRDGHFYPVEFTASPVIESDRPVGTVVEVRDLTALRAAERERERLLDQVEAERQRLQRIFHHVPALISVTRGPDHVYELVNPAAQAMLGGRIMLGRPLREVFPEVEGQGFLELRDRVFRTGETVEQREARILLDLNGDGRTEEHFLHFVNQPMRDEAGNIEGVMTFAVEVTEQVRSRARAQEAHAAELAAAERLRVLADAGALLGSSLDLQETLQQLSRLLVPRWADWCFVELLAEDGRIEPVVVHHSDPAMRELAREALLRYPVDPDSPVGTPRVLRTGEPDLVPNLPEEFLRTAARDAEHLELLLRVGFHSHIAVPLVVRETSIGVLSLVMADTERSFGEEDLPFAMELASRAALAIDSSRLFAAEREAREVAERSADHARRLAALASALNEAATVEEVAAACIDSGAAALGASRGSMALLLPGGDAFEVVRTSDQAGVADRWRRFPLDPRKPLSHAVLHGEPVLIPDVRDRATDFPLLLSDLAETGTVAFVALPIRVRGRTLGGLAFSFTSRQAFDELDRTFTAALADQAAQALERAQLLESERTARTEAEEANRAKTEFLSAMSHELRTPLNAIAGYVDLLDADVHGTLTEDQRRDLERIKRAQGVLLGLITDVLNFARLEAGRIVVREDVVEIRSLLNDLEELLGPQVRHRGLTYTSEVPSEGVRARGDAERTQQILLNLVGNATKFTDPGGEIRIGASEEGPVVRITVRDTGRGIPAEKLESIFEPFVQLERQAARESQQGVGLGLAISRELARAMKGDLTARSAPGEGSEFELTLPSATAPSS